MKFKLQIKPSLIFIAITSLNYFVFCIVYYLELRKEDINIEGVSFTAMPLSLPNESIGLISWIFAVLITAGILVYFKTPFKRNIPANRNSAPLNDFFISKTFESLAIGIISLLLLCCTIHFSYLDWSLLYLNYEYQIIKTPNLISQDGGTFFRIFHFLFRLIGIFSAVFLCYSVARKRPLLLVVSLLVTAYCFFLLFIGESRWVNVYIAVFFISRLVLFKRKPTYFEYLIWGAVFVLLFCKVIVGRNYGIYGISAQLKIFSYLFEIDFANIILGLFINFSDGFINLANSIELRTNYSEEYKLLSFSPLPSSIDGFSSILELNERRINFYVPFNSISEAWSFGGVYFALLTFLLIAFIYSCDLIYSISKPLVQSLILAIALWNLFYMFGYPIRNVMRVFEYMIIINLFFYIRTNNR